MMAIPGLLEAPSQEETDFDKEGYVKL